MFTHRVPRATMHEDLLDIKRVQCERVVSIEVDPSDPEFYLVHTVSDDGVELRGAS